MLRTETFGFGGAPEPPNLGLLESMLPYQLLLLYTVRSFAYSVVVLPSLCAGQTLIYFSGPFGVFFFPSASGHIPRTRCDRVVCKASPSP